MAATWGTTVTDIMRIFQSAVVALVPSMEAARIPWRPPSAYDDWEEIAACLFKHLVGRSIAWSLPEPVRATFHMDGYDPIATAPDIRGGALLVLHHTFERPLVFRRLQTTVQPFDAVEAWDERGVSTQVSFDEASFAVSVGSAPNQKILKFVNVAL